MVEEKKGINYMDISQLRKHYGYLNNTGTRIIVVFRELPTDPKHALVVSLDSLPDAWRDEVLNAVNSQAGQATVDFYTALQNRNFSDGSNALTGLHQRGYLKKVPIEQVTMTPLTGQKVPLSLINASINKTLDTYVADEVAATPAEIAVTIDPVVLAEGLLTEAKMLEVQAEAKRNEAYALAPSLKPGRGRPAQLDEDDKARIALERKEKRKARDQANVIKAKEEKKIQDAKDRLDKKILRDANKVSTVQ